MLLFFPALATAQTSPDTTARTTLIEEVVVTGQFEPISVRNSVYKVRSIGPEQIPYTFGDLVFTNHLAGVKAQQIIFKNEEGTSTGNPSYEDFSETDLSGLTLSPQRNVISSNWRATTGDNAGAFQDRYYLIQDVTGNIYKLKFLVMGAGGDGGERGYPQLEYQLVKSK